MNQFRRRRIFDFVGLFTANVVDRLLFVAGWLVAKPLLWMNEKAFVEVTSWFMLVNTYNWFIYAYLRCKICAGLKSCPKGLSGEELYYRCFIHAIEGKLDEGGKQ